MNMYLQCMAVVMCSIFFILLQNNDRISSVLKQDAGEFNRLPPDLILPNPLQPQTETDYPSLPKGNTILSFSKQ